MTCHEECGCSGVEWRVSVEWRWCASIPHLFCSLSLDLRRPWLAPISLPSGSDTCPITNKATETFTLCIYSDEIYENILRNRVDSFTFDDRFKNNKAFQSLLTQMKWIVRSVHSAASGLITFRLRGAGGGGGGGAGEGHGLYGSIPDASDRIDSILYS